MSHRELVKRISFGESNTQNMVHAGALSRDSLSFKSITKACLLGYLPGDIYYELHIFEVTYRKPYDFWRYIASVDQTELTWLL